LTEHSETLRDTWRAIGRSASSVADPLVLDCWIGGLSGRCLLHDHHRAVPDFDNLVDALTVYLLFLGAQSVPTDEQALQKCRIARQ
jgi:hypothetical protein